MATDFTYGNKLIAASGPIKPTTKDSPLDGRTRVETYAAIESIPGPYVGMVITVIADETNSGKMTDYKVTSLKANALGQPNSLIDTVVKYTDYLGVATGGGTGGGLTSEQTENLNKIPTIEQDVTNLKTTVGDNSSGLIKDVKDLKTNGISQDNINSAVEKYLQDNPVQSGATAEQAAQIEANKTAIGDVDSGLIKEINDIKNTELQNLNTAIQTLETLVGVDETLGDKSGLPSEDKNVIASINRIDKKTSGNVTDEQISMAVNNYLTEHPIDNSITCSDIAEDDLFTVDTIYADIIISVSNIVMNENSTTTFNVKLASAPLEEQYVSLTVNNSNCTLNKNSLIFTENNYNNEQTVTITAIHDNDDYTNLSATITVSSSGVTSKVIQVTITNIDELPVVRVQSVTLNTKTLSINKNSSKKLIATILPEESSNKNLIWTSNNENATVDNTGLVRGISVGSSQITVRTEDGDFTDTCDVTINDITTGYDTDNLIGLYKFNESHVIDNSIAPIYGSISPTINNVLSENITENSIYTNGTDGYILFENLGVPVNSDMSFILKFNKITPTIKIGGHYGDSLYLELGNSSSRIIRHNYTVQISDLTLESNEDITLGLVYSYTNKSLTIYKNGIKINDYSLDSKGNDNDILYKFALGCWIQNGITATNFTQVYYYGMAVYKKALDSDGINLASQYI